MKRIPLTQGKYAIVDDEDYGVLLSYSWVYSDDRTNEYAHTTLRVGGKKTTVKMHRMIMEAPKGKQVDHMNHNGLDNRKTNLRLCTNSQNQANANVKSNSGTGIKGVHRRKDNGRWRAHALRNGKRVWLGHFNTAKEAAMAYNNYVKKFDGEFARLNEV